MVLATAIRTLDRDAGPLEGVEAGSWSLGTVEQSRARAAVDCGERDRRDAREELVVGKCQWRNARRPWNQGDTAESHIWGGAPSP